MYWQFLSANLIMFFWVDAFLRRKVGIPRGVLPDVQRGLLESRLALLIQDVGILVRTLVQANSFTFQPSLNLTPKLQQFEHNLADLKFVCRWRIQANTNWALPTWSWPVPGWPTNSTLGIIQALWRPFLTSDWFPILEPISTSVLPID